MKFYLLLIILTSFLFRDISAQWVQCKGPYGGAVYSIGEIQVNGNKIIFAGTETGIYRCINNYNWEYFSNGLPQLWKYTYAFLFTGDSVWAGTEDGLYYSKDLGNNWIKITAGLPEYSSVKSLTAKDSYLFAGVMGKGVYRSSDNGSTWQYCGAGSYPYVEALLVKGTKIYAGIVHDGVYYSTNNGDNWVKANTGGTDKDILTLASLGSKIYAGTGTAIYVSDDEGLSWNTINFQGTLSLASKESNLYAGTENGIYISTDGGTSWTLSNNGLLNSVKCISFIENNILAGTDGAGVYLSTNSGTDWKNVSNGMENIPVNNIIYDGKNIYAATREGGVFISSNSGNTWNDVNNGLGQYNVQNLLLDKGVLYAASKGIYCSTNNGSSWREIDSGLTNNAQYVKCFASSGDNIYAGTYDGIYLSVDKGASWHYFGLTNQEVSSIVIKDSLVFAATEYSGIYRSNLASDIWQPCNNGIFGLEIKSISKYGDDLFAGCAAGFYRSTDNGNSWFSAGFVQENEVNALAYLNWNIFIGTLGFGVYGSMDSGQSWTWISDFMDVKTLAIVDEYLFAGTSTGIFKRPLKEITSIKDQNSFNTLTQYSLGQNYPNPFNPSTNIKYSIADLKMVTIKLYNILGQEISTLVNEIKSPGTYEVQFDAGSLPSGIYLYKMQAGSYSFSRKMIYIR